MKKVIGMASPSHRRISVLRRGVTCAIYYYCYCYCYYYYYDHDNMGLFPVPLATITASTTIITASVVG